eukprot:1635852-Pleurochrysis_carterae.AAC.3
MAAVFGSFAPIAVVRRASIFRVKRVARKLCFAFSDRELVFILSGKLLWRESQGLGRLARNVAHAKRAAHFHGTRARIARKQHIADCGLQFLVHRGLGGGVGGCASRAGSLSATVVLGLVPLRTVAMPMRAAAMAAFHKAFVPRPGLRLASFVTSVPRRVASLAASVRRRSRGCGRSAP